MSKRDFQDLSSDIYQNWYANAGPCENCPNRDPCHYFTPKNIDPGYHSGDADADVLIVGLEPSDTYPDTRPRDDSQLGIGCEAAEWDSGDRADTFAEYYQALNPDPIEDVHDGSVDIERLGSLLFTSLDSYYYTNSKKCANVGRDDEAARDRCFEYLLAQIEIIQPSVIVALGKETIRLFAEESSIPVEKPLYAYALNQFQFRDSTVIPAYHWAVRDRGGLHKNAKEALGVSDIADFYERLVEAIKDAR